jgi:hypothetical protein
MGVINATSLRKYRERTNPVRHKSPLKGDALMIRWKTRYMRFMIVLGAFASFVVASGAGSRWQ